MAGVGRHRRADLGELRFWYIKWHFRRLRGHYPSQALARMARSHSTKDASA